MLIKCLFHLFSQFQLYQHISISASGTDCFYIFTANRYIITCRRSQLTLYYEPHCVYNHSILQKYQADAVITPVIKQLLPGFTLVSGQEDAVNLAKLLQAKYVSILLMFIIFYADVIGSSL